jgi:hypothetical protein
LGLLDTSNEEKSINDRDLKSTILLFVELLKEVVIESKLLVIVEAIRIIVLEFY